ncbi:Ig lambda chain V-V region DEL [Liparis tanakae]|uniref:Ig lambda chain V-V region DEL n=1 Tax=Liparis tanakae TaxID=230148 RepID=A0A4Z2HT50_9TELE|nr:Ig lambda chain V-V region DEL [Liparis tanakae]
MTSIRFLLLLALLLVHQISSEEAELVLRAEGTNIELGYCFGADYIVVYRCAPEGDQLLGNSSAGNASITPPADLQSRIHINSQQYLLGLQIQHLTHEDSGVYRRECWQNQTLASQYTQQLYVCNEEVASEEILVMEGDAGAELLCNNTSIGLEGTSVRWYHETYPLYKPTLFLDTSVSLHPLLEQLEGFMEVKDNGALLWVDSSMLENNQHYLCHVSQGKNCLSFQSMHPADRGESSDMFASAGDKVVLQCSSDGNDQQWDTPLGRLNSSSVTMYVSFGDKSEDFSLVIPAFSDDLSGEYSCISSSLEVHYVLAVCPRRESQELVVAEGESALLNCDVGKDVSQTVQWHRREPSGKNELIHDSKDETVPIPEDLRGRLSPSENGSSLTISHLEAKDQGTYWCVVLLDHGFLEDDDDDYKEDYEDEGAGEDEFSDGLYWDNTQKCIFKQETRLTSIPINVRIPEPATSKPETSQTDPSGVSNFAGYAVGGGVVVLLVCGGIFAVIAKKRRAKTNATKNMNMNVDPGCTEVLTPDD